MQIKMQKDLIYLTFSVPDIFSLLLISWTSVWVGGVLHNHSKLLYINKNYYFIKKHIIRKYSSQVKEYTHIRGYILWELSPPSISNKILQSNKYHRHDVFDSLE